MKYRSRDEITASLLQYAAENGTIAKTKMMYNSFLSYSQLLQYLEFLTGNALLKYDKLDKKYKITSKGLEFLDVYNKIEKLVKI
jgi:predicted transcriptional regulator